MESQVNLSSRSTVLNPRVLEGERTICIRKLFTIQTAASSYLLGPDGDLIPHCETSSDYVTNADHPGQGFITANTLQDW